MTKGRVALGLSGGVDSAVSAYLLKEAGYSVSCIFLKVYEPEHAYADECTWKEDMESALRVAEKLELPFESWNFQQEYKKTVLAYFFDELKKGRTPNPDTLCNRDIKFGVFYEKAKKQGFDFVATGHYAQNEINSTGNFELHMGNDSSKDQSYFLSRIKPSVLPDILFPIGSYTKSQIRKIARDIHLPNADRKDSQGICFLGNINVKDFIRRYCDLIPGPIVLEDGTQIGTHKGLELYTIGQREGIGIGGSQEPFFVVAKQLHSNSLVVAVGKHASSLYTVQCTLTEVIWFEKPIKFPFVCLGIFRYRQTPQKITVQENINATTIIFDKPQRAITPGQICALYAGTRVIGSGVIVR